MTKNNIAILHSSKMVFDTIDEVRNYDYFSNLKIGDTIIILGNVTMGDGTFQVRKIEAQNDTTSTGILLKDKRYAVLVYDIKVSNEGASKEKSITLSDFFLAKESNKIPLTGLTTQDIDNAKEIILYTKCEAGTSVGMCPMISIPIPAELKTGVTGYLVSSSDGTTTKMIAVVFKIDSNNNLSYQLVSAGDVSSIKDTIGSTKVIKNITVVVK